MDFSSGMAILTYQIFPLTEISITAIYTRKNIYMPVQTTPTVSVSHTYFNRPSPCTFRRSYDPETFFKPRMNQQFTNRVLLRRSRVHFTFFTVVNYTKYYTYKLYNQNISRIFVRLLKVMALVGIHILKVVQKFCQSQKYTKFKKSCS